MTQNHDAFWSRCAPRVNIGVHSIPQPLKGRSHKVHLRFAESTNDASGNLNRLDIHGLKHELESLNLVKNAEVHRDLPNTLIIEITERQPAAVLKSGRNTYTVDSEGYILEATPNVALPEVNVDFGIAVDGKKIADELINQIAAALASDDAKNIKNMHIDRNREIYFTLYNVEPRFYLEKNMLNDNYIRKARTLSAGLSNSNIKIPKHIDIYSFDDKSIGFY